MDENSRWRPIAMQALFAMLCLAVIFFQLLPLDPALPSPLDGQSILSTGLYPDLMLGLAYAWVLRRPDYAPVILIALLTLLADLLFQRPPGLWTLLVVLGAEFLRARAAGLADLPYGAEWMSVAMVMLLVAVAYRMILAVLLVDVAPFAPALVQMVMTILCYPVLVLVTQLVFGVRRPTARDQAAGRGIV